MRIVVAVNPSASFGRRKPLGPVVVERLGAAGHDVVALDRSSYDDLLAATRSAVESRPDALVVVGGDGMVSLGTGLLAQSGIPLGIVPTGTGNDFARALGIPYEEPLEALHLLEGWLGHPPLSVDALRVRRTDGGTTWVAGGVSAGFDAFVNERANRMRRPRGRIRYDIALVLELLRLRRVDYEITIDGREQSVPGILVTVGNAPSVGGGIRLLPDAVIDDGLADVLVVDRLSRATFVRLFPRVAKGTHTGDARVNVSRATRVTIDAPGVAAYGDGERIGPLPVDVEIVPGALRVFAPPRAPGGGGSISTS
ncbi:diacylglycerol/lipid kinase family protein [Frondihabitans cladoniiphilus]|uniref:Diacylglycerol kinase n=1 Tax=Frondihabitans cladoniiphilus TaxID=715785 RepID=A0ABP8VSU0_9MICO